jgi:hypothetical protein
MVCETVSSSHLMYLESLRSINPDWLHVKMRPTGYVRVLENRGTGCGVKMFPTER